MFSYHKSRLVSSTAAVHHYRSKKFQRLFISPCPDRYAACVVGRFSALPSFFFSTPLEHQKKKKKYQTHNTAIVLTPIYIYSTYIASQKNYSAPVYTAPLPFYPLIVFRPIFNFFLARFFSLYYYYYYCYYIILNICSSI